MQALGCSQAAVSRTRLTTATTWQAVSQGLDVGADRFVVPAQAESDRRERAQEGCDGCTEEDRLDLHEPAASSALVSVWSGRAATVS